ncbi:helix-turn-helix domain-containing protein [Actinokineospora iranica]|uniref:Helix-turn-helix domain-containing protein n=1 Tax=Actinokineospora iranica TaxID=1271860 RepID=A0A1G6NZW9_9PSEU|nr:helix-turn-helix transcriptional regulator [Actinokineospora iranica]SDC72725.1 Helix-turn-helix domain-containing protein [Actinokineospora iranica]
MASPATTAYRVVLGIFLRSIRERVGLTPTEVAHGFGWYGVGKVSKIEAGTVRLGEEELDRLLTLYEVTGPEADKLREFGTEARKRTSPGRTPAWGETYKVLEAQAAEIKHYRETVLPGTVQTEDYARALLSMSLTTPPAEVGRTARERAKRQELLTSGNPPGFWLVVAEPVLLRPVGGTDVFRAQLLRLRELVELPHITFQVLPFGKGEHHAIGTPFTLLRLALPTLSVAYLEGLTDANYLDHPKAAEVYTLAFDKLRVTALDDRESANLLDQRINELK